MYIPAEVRKILQRLAANGWQAYTVGGCVRDSLMGRIPNDWDICTNALPQQVERCFEGETVLETGIRHGTVTLVRDHVPYEITTYRIDGEYRDHRRPEAVQFVTNLEQDLARRDFTVNAMACGLNGTIRDPFGGRGDLQKKIIRCVGEPECRFEEDALRILRALRFASVLGFELHPDTLAAAREKQALLDDIAAERVFSELEKLICGSGAGPVLKQCGDILAQVLPEIGPCIGFDQQNPCHDRDVWVHTVDALTAAPPERVLRWALLLHDLAKPLCFTVDDRGIGHSYGHQKMGAEMAHKIFRRLKTDKKLEEDACQLIYYHDAELVSTRTSVLHWLNRLGTEQLQRLITMKRCDIGAHCMIPRMQGRAEEVEQFAQQAQRAIQEGVCTSIAELAVTGRDLIRQGVTPGPAVGQMLQDLLNQVLDLALPNERKALLGWAAAHAAAE